MKTPNPSLALYTDLYQLTMAQAYWRSDQDGRATFSLFIRNYPPNRGYFVFAGLEHVLTYLENFHFTADDLDLLRSFGRFDDRFLSDLGELRFTGSVRAMREGSLFFINEPVLEVVAPIIEAQLVETYILNQMHVQTLLATKAARVRFAAGDRQVVDFAARRTHGAEAGNLLARVGYLVGFDATSNVMAATLYGIPPSGTMAHSFITTYESEIDAFRSFAETFPDHTILVVDTYDTLAGVRKAIVVAKELAKHGHRLHGVRLDSGDLFELSRQTRRLLDDAGCQGVRIFASGGLDEFEIATLLDAGAPIDGFGVGTRVGCSADAPWTDCAYKMVEYDNRPVLKLSTRKQTLPGAKQVFRFRGADGSYTHDTIACAGEAPPPGAEELLAPVMVAGRRLRPDPLLTDLRTRFAADFAALPAPHKRLLAPSLYEVRISDELQRLQDETATETRRSELPA